MNDLARLFASTHVGNVRSVNEDRCRTPRWAASGANESWSGSVDRDAVWAVVADGMGGHGAGDVASEIATRSIATALTQAIDVDHIAAAIHAANEKVHDAMADHGGRRGMGTTIAGLLVRGRSCIAFNVGDSRAYLLHGRRLECLTVDHTPLTGPGKIRSHALTQSLGGTLSRRSLAPHIFEIDVEPGDRLVLCSDGLTDLVENEEIVRILQESDDQPAERLVHAALVAGGRDNVTVVVIDLRV